MTDTFPPESPSYFFPTGTAIDIYHNYSEVCCCIDLSAGSGPTLTSAVKGCTVYFCIHGGHVTYQVVDMIGYNGCGHNSGYLGETGPLVFVEILNL